MHLEGYQLFLLPSIHWSIWYLRKPTLWVDNLCFGGNVPFSTPRLIVETEIPNNSETSLILKKWRFWRFIMNLKRGQKWVKNGSFFQIFRFYYFNSSQSASNSTHSTIARGVNFMIHSNSLDPTRGLFFMKDISNTNIAKIFVFSSSKSQ